MPPRGCRRYDFSIACRGVRDAEVWLGREVAIIFERGYTAQWHQLVTAKSNSIGQHLKSAITSAFDATYLAFAEICGGHPSRVESPCDGRVVIQVPLDNAGAGGLAHHDVGGISVGHGLVMPLVRRWVSAVNEMPDLHWLPRFDGGLEGLKFGVKTPRDASVDQVFFYEMARNFWKPEFNKKVDWYCDDNETCWGWWTVGMCNAMAIIIPAIVDLPMYYFGQGRHEFRNRMVAELAAYRSYSSGIQNPFHAWTCSLMPWNPKESVNDLMTALIVRSFERFGGTRWISGFFREIRRVPDINSTDAGENNFQAARDNLYRIWSRAAEADLRNVFQLELWWEISPRVCAEIAAEFPKSARLSLALQDLSL